MYSTEGSLDARYNAHRNCWTKPSSLDLKKVAMIVHCGLPHDSFEALACLPNYCARKIWTKLSTSVVGVNKKVAMIVQCGLSQLHIAPLGTYATMLADPE